MVVPEAVVYNPAMLQETASSLPFGDPARADAALSTSIRNLRGSQILRIAGEIREAKAAGRDIANLTVGDFDARQFPIPDVLRAAIERALADGQTNYPPSNGIPELRAAIARHAARAWGVSYPVESVLVASGARPTIYGTYFATVDPGDVVVYPVPSWNNEYYVELSGAEGVPLVTSPEHDFMPTLEDIEPHLGEARLICLNTPSNPTGTVMDPTMVAPLARAVVDENGRRERDGRRPVYLLLDAVYAALTFGESRFAHPVEAVPEAAPWVLTVDGVSKAFAGTGLRVGWVLAPPAIAKRLNALLGHVGAWAPRPEQCGTAAFLDDPEAVDAFGVEMRARAHGRLQALYGGFEAMREEGFPVRCIEPQGAIYLSLRLDWVGRRFDGTTIDDGEAVRRILLDEAGMGVVPFQAFGYPGESGWFRISVGAISVDDVARMLPRLRAVMERLD